MRSSETRLDQIKGCKELSVKYFPTETSLVKQVDKIYYEIIKKMGNVKPQTRSQQANFVLAVRSYRALHCALDNIENGYYEVAMTILRSIYENYVQMDYFVTREEAARQWLAEEKTFKQGDMRKELGLSNDFYNMLSNNYAHPRELKSIKPLVLDISDDGKLSINHYPVFSNSECYTTLFVWIFLANKCIDQIQRVFKAADIAPFVEKQWIQEMQDIKNLVEQYVAEEKYLHEKIRKQKEVNSK